MIDMKSLRQYLRPMRESGLFDDQINRFRIAPFFQNRLFVQKSVGRWSPNRRLFQRVLINEQEFSVEVKNETTAVVERSLEQNMFVNVGIEKASQIGQ